MMSAVITGKKITLLPRWTAIINARQSSTHAHMHTLTLHTHWLVVSTWLGNHQGRPSAPLIRRAKH